MTRVTLPERLCPVNDSAHSWGWGRNIPTALARNAALSCLRAPACTAAQPDAKAALAGLVVMVRRHPVDGVARGIDGKLHHVHVNETRLLEIAEANMLNAGELAAAADALAVGDEKPLLRLAAEIPPGGGNAGDPALFSAGDNAAAFCNDSDFVWNRHDSVALRRAKYHKALIALGPRSFAPFSPRVWAKFYVADFCLRWPAPDRFTPAVPRGATVTGVPALILSGDLDTTFRPKPPAGCSRYFGARGSSILPGPRIRRLAGVSVHRPSRSASSARSPFGVPRVANRRTLRRPSLHSPGPQLKPPRPTPFPGTPRRKPIAES